MNISTANNRRSNSCWRRAKIRTAHRKNNGVIITSNTHERVRLLNNLPYLNKTPTSAALVAANASSNHVKTGPNWGKLNMAMKDEGSNIIAIRNNIHWFFLLDSISFNWPRLVDIFIRQSGVLPSCTIMVNISI